jgi:hypothetical protein
MLLRWILPDCAFRSIYCDREPAPSSDHKVPVKFNALGMPYVDSSVSAISPQKLSDMVERERAKR